MENSSEFEEIVMTRKDGYGFHILYIPKQQPLDPIEDYIAVSGDDYEDITEVHSAGEPLKLCRAFFVSEETACKIVRRFIKDGTRLKAEEFAWISRYQLDWEF